MVYEPSLNMETHVARFAAAALDLLKLFVVLVKDLKRFLFGLEALDDDKAV